MKKFRNADRFAAQGARNHLAPFSSPCERQLPLTCQQAGDIAIADTFNPSRMQVTVQ
tara:strand:- start:46603 stop:46773 length:171 start_codon:yes stop_codon:yes gene_type:complete